MLVHSDQFYGVLFNNQKISSIRSIKREEAMEFVDQVRRRSPVSSVFPATHLAHIGGTSPIVITQLFLPARTSLALLSLFLVCLLCNIDRVVLLCILAHCPELSMPDLSTR